MTLRAGAQGNNFTMETLAAAASPPISATTIDYAILIDLEATSDSSDDALTRLQQCDHHEIIEFVRLPVSEPAARCAMPLTQQPSARAERGPGRRGRAAHDLPCRDRAPHAARRA